MLDIIPDSAKCTFLNQKMLKKILIDFKVAKLEWSTCFRIAWASFWQSIRLFNVSNKSPCYSSNVYTFTEYIVLTLVAPCEHNVCLNGGTCVKDGQDFDCACAAGYSGKFCQVGEHAFNIFI